MSAPIPLIDPITYDLTVTRAEGIVLPVISKIAGVQEDISARTMSFKIYDLATPPTTLVSLTPEAHPTDSLGRMIHVTQIQISGLPRHTTFALIETNGSEPRVRWSGKLTVREVGEV